MEITMKGSPEEIAEAEKAQAEYDDIINGRKTINEVRASYGLPPLPGAADDALLIRVNADES